MPTVLKLLFILVQFSNYYCSSSSSPNKAYIYKYESFVEVAYSQEEKLSLKQLPIHYNIETRVYLEEVNKVVSENNHVVEFVAKLDDISNGLYSDKTIEALRNEPFMFELDTKNGRVLALAFSEHDRPGSILFKKSFVDHFNFDNSNVNSFLGTFDSKTEIIRNDSNSIEFNISRTNFSRSFNLNGEFKRKEDVLNSIIDRSISLKYDILKDGWLIQSIESIDLLKIYNEFNSKSFQKIKSKQRIQLVKETESRNLGESKPLKSSVLSGFTEISDINTIAESLSFVDDPKLKNEKKLEKRVKNYYKKSKTGTRIACRNFLKLVKTVRMFSNAKKDLIKTAFDNIIKKSNFGKYAIEILSAAQTNTSEESLRKSLKIDDLVNGESVKDSKSIDEYLLVAPLITHANEVNLKTILDIYNHTDRIEAFGIRKRTSLAVGSLFSLIGDHHPDSESQIDRLVTQLRRCETESCRVIYLEAIRNSKSRPSFDAVIAYFEETCSKSKVVAGNNDICAHVLKVLGAYPSRFFSSSSDGGRLFKRLSKIFDHLSYSSDMRMESFQVLVEKYNILESQALLENVLATMSREMMKKPKEIDFEFLLYIQRYILQKSQFNSDLRSRLELALKTSKVTYFKFFILTGLSNVMENSLKSYERGNLNYNLRQLLTNSGYLKLVDFGVSFHDSDNNPMIDFLRFELFGNNMDTILSGGKDREASSSIHLSVMGQKVKIFELFRGYKELVSLVWSLPSHMTSFFSANFLTNDQNEYVLLQNGMIVRVECLGALSFDLSGSSEVSMWSQYAKTKLKLSPAILIEQKSTLINDFAILKSVQLDFDTDFSIDSNFDIDISSSPYKLCLKMSHKKFHLREGIRVFGNSDEKEEAHKQLAIQAATYMFSREAVSFC